MVPKMLNNNFNRDSNNIPFETGPNGEYKITPASKLLASQIKFIQGWPIKPMSKRAL